jgi:hypothetical protein
MVYPMDLLEVEVVVDQLLSFFYYHHDYQGQV